jgi:toxin ParE1/3/4
VTHRLVFLAAAKEDLDQIYDWIADRADPQTAIDYVGRIEEACGTLLSFPRRGSPRDDLGPGVRTISFERQAMIAYIIENRVVRIVRSLRKGQDPNRAFFEQ